MAEGGIFFLIRTLTSTLEGDHESNGTAITNPFFGRSRDTKVIVSMSLGHSVLDKLRRCATENSQSEIRLDHDDLLVMDGQTQFEYEQLHGV